MTQRDRVLELLADGRWHNGAELLENGEWRYTARVHELRLSGHLIESRRAARSPLAEYRLIPAVPTPMPSRRWRSSRRATSTSSRSTSSLARPPRERAGSDRRGARRLLERVAGDSARPVEAGQLPGFRLFAKPGDVVKTAKGKRQRGGPVRFRLSEVLDVLETWRDGPPPRLS